MMKRDQVLKILARHLDREIVIGAYSTAFDWIATRPGHPLNFTSVGAMGLASSHGLGFAIACPDRKVIVLDGDGSLLMNLGSLVTIAAAAPANLLHFVFENGTYEANGGHPIPGQGRVDFAGMARSAGYAAVYRFEDLGTFETGIKEVLQQPGPVFADLKVVPGADSPRDYAELYDPGKRDALRAELRRG
ncbi:MULTISPECIES: thiamine pyrophosphate-dependent enzyme [Chelativorans]|jgi:phosphonopyruvate decarboxylase|uniref:Thiamine pyrophosphate enzyme-like TPP-binding protein n=1 Tax=Chelativorans sp. (strain BNC1) TaxID=266779 RepID=Q11K72_CHESB|nr:MULTISPECIES: thiamine pyrophosphate-dependent enzyme [Chelativorans]